jgi:hypothetical protein
MGMGIAMSPISTHRGMDGGLVFFNEGELGLDAVPELEQEVTVSNGHMGWQRPEDRRLAGARASSPGCRGGSPKSRETMRIKPTEYPRA